MIEVISSGESHGKGLIGIIKGIPQGLKVDETFINEMLSLRQKGYGRGKRMQIEKDKINIIGGVDKNSVTLGNPVGFFIENKDYTLNKTERFFKTPRPGHSDFAGSIKYNFENIAIPSERGSGRLTAIDVAAGSIAMLLLKEFNIDIYFFVQCIGNICIDYKEFSKEAFLKAKASDLFVTDREGEMKNLIDKVSKEGDTIGGKGIVVVKNVIAGLGDYNDWKKRADGLIAQSVMSIGTVKSVTIGNDETFLGSKYNDPFFIKNGFIDRPSNNAGGIEGGITNGEDIIVKFFSKPIPTVKKGIPSVNLGKWENESSVYVRSDVVVVPTVTLVAAMRIALTVASLFLDKFKGDTMKDVKSSFNYYRETRRRFWQR